MTAHQRELFTPRAPERRGLRDWLYLELHTSGSMSVEELRLRAVMAGYRDDEDGAAFDHALVAGVGLLGSIPAGPTPGAGGVPVNRYRALTMRWPDLTDEEHGERLRLALAGWHECLLDSPHTCGRSPGDDDDGYRPPDDPSRRAGCAACSQEPEQTEEPISVGDLLSGRRSRDLRHGRLSAVIDNTESNHDAPG